MFSDEQLLLHEIAHASAALWAGASRCVIRLSDTHGECIPEWPDNRCADWQMIAAIVGGRAYVVPGMDITADTLALALVDREKVEAIAAKVLPIVADRLECINGHMVDAMLAELRECGALVLTASAVH